MERDRFYKLVESKLGNVKPLLGEQTSEQTEAPETKSNVKNTLKLINMKSEKK